MNIYVCLLESSGQNLSDDEIATLTETNARNGGCAMKERMLYVSVILVLLFLTLCSCGTQKGTVIDYGDAEAFESALNEGKNLEGKVVRFTVREFQPSSELGYNALAGEKLNFVSARNPNIQENDVVTAKAKTVENRSGIWVINYEKVNDGIVGEDTITISEKKEVTTTSLTFQSTIIETTLATTTSISTSTTIQTPAETRPVLHGFNNGEKENISFSINRLTFSIPPYYVENPEHKTDHMIEFLASDDGQTTVACFFVKNYQEQPQDGTPIKDFLSEFEKKAIGYLQDSGMENTEIISEESITVAGKDALQTHYTALTDHNIEFDSYDINVYDEEDHSVYLIRFQELSTRIYDMSEDRKAILNHITLSDNKNSASSQSGSRW